MSPAELLAELGRRGIRLAADGQDLKVDAPRGALSSDLLVALREYKPRLLAFLVAEPLPAPSADGGRCERHSRWLTFSEQLHGACSWCEAPPERPATWPGNRQARRLEWN